MHRIFGVSLVVVAGLLLAYYWSSDKEAPAPPTFQGPGWEQEADAEAGDPPSPSAVPEAETLRREAKNYIEEISGALEDPVPVRQADDFVVPDRTIDLGGQPRHEGLTGEDLLAMERFDPNASLRVLRQREEVEYRTLAELLSTHEGEMDTTLQVLESGGVKRKVLGRLLEEKAGRLQESVPVIVLREYEEVTTVGEEARRLGGDPERFVQVIRSPDRPRSTTVRELLSGREQVTKDSVFYIRNVTKGDEQGIWGILHRGIIKKFATGIAVRRNEEINRYQVRIPRNADEREQDDSSSFLGRLLDKKARRSFVYNHEKGFMGRNPDLIYPGQELVIVAFSTEELISIYQHFVNRGQPAFLERGATVGSPPGPSRRVSEDG